MTMCLSVYVYPHHSVSKLSKMSHFNFLIWHFPPIFAQLKLTYLVTFQKLLKILITHKLYKKKLMGAS